MKIVVLLMLIGVIVGFSHLHGRGQAKPARPDSMPEEAEAAAAPSISG